MRAAAVPSARMTQAARSLTLFFTATFALAWIVWLVTALMVPASINPNLRALLFLPGTFAPGIIGVWLTHREGGDAATQRLIERVFRWQVAARWYLFAVSYLIVVKLIAAGIYRVATGIWPTFGELPVYLVVGALLLSTPFQAGEEIGWRGYALPRLAERMGLSWASVALGIIWACWHLPLFYIAGTDTSGQPFPVYLLAVTAASVAMSWLYVRSHGSLLLVMLMHAALNNTGGIVSGRTPNATDPLAVTAAPVAWLTSVILSACAVFFFLRLRGARLKGV